MLNGRTTIEEAWNFEFTIDNQSYNIVILTIKNQKKQIIKFSDDANLCCIFDTQFYHPAK